MTAAVAEKKTTKSKKEKALVIVESPAKSKTIKIRLFCRDRNRNEKYSKWITINVR